MAHSVVKVTDIKDDELNDSLLLLVGEDGTVTPDQDTVETFLKQRNGPTNIQIMKINKSEKQGIDITVDNVTYMPDAVKEEIVKPELEMDEVARNLYNFKLDHDYTPLTSPKRPSSPQEEDELVKTLSILDGPDPDHSISTLIGSEPPPLILTTPHKVDKVPPKVKIIHSITITPAGSHTTSTKTTVALSQPTAQPSHQIVNSVLHSAVQNDSSTPASLSPMQVIPTSTIGIDGQNVTPISTKPKAKIIKTLIKPIHRPERAKPTKPKTKVVREIVEEESEDEFGEEDFDFEVDDDENDSDFDIEEELKSKQTPKRIGRRTKSESKTFPRIHKIIPKSRSKENREIKEPSKVETKIEKAVEKSIEKSPEKPVEKPPEQKPEPTEVKPPEKKPPKKEKKIPKPIPDDFALFSTPDIIRRVGGKEPTTPNTPDATTPTKPGKITNESRSKSSTENPQSPSKHNRNSVDGKSPFEKEKHSNHHHVEGKSKERRISSGDSKSKRISIDEKSKSDHSKPDKYNLDSKRIERQHSRVNEMTGNMENSEVIPSAEDIRSIIMNEDTKSFTTSTLPLDLNNSDPQNMDPNNLNIDATGLDIDPTLLDNLNNDEISEDILYQVAQSLVSNPELQNAIDKGINEGVLDAMTVDQAVVPNQMPSLQESNDVIQKGTQIVRPDGRIVVIPPIERPTTRSRNKKKEEAKQVFKPAHKPLDDEHVSGNELDSSNEEEDESEDDPNKLWCICNQPHNNRFMICCDTCEEWYHGKCVNITKAMGQQMEAEGKEWICLFCKDPMLKRPQAAARRIRKASRNSRASTDSTGSSTKKTENTSSVPCVVCQKLARKNSIYCSEACILAHAQGIERVVVFERTTGNMLTGNKAPSASNLENWLKDHPGYEVVRSGGRVVTAKATNFTQSKLKLVKNTDNEGVSIAVQKKGINLGILKHSPKTVQQQPKLPLKATVTGIKIISKQVSMKEPKTKLIQPQPISKPVATTPPLKTKIIQPTLTPKTPQVSPPKPNKIIIPKEKILVKTPKPKPQPEQPTTPQPKPQENIRENVQKTVFEQLMNRLKSNEDLKLSEEEVKNISTEIESQLFKCFGDTGQKYRNKYRSLIFNIKDAKNQTLWRKICEKSINPYELVRLSPDDLASQELAMWREREAKHQLDMIKKSELELLNCNRQYVLKTHKGEQVVEDDRTDKTDNAEVIKSLTEGSTLDTGEAKRDGSKDRDKKSSKHGHKDKDRDRKSSKDKEHHSHRSSSKDKERDRDRSRKRSRSRDRSRHSEHKKRSRSRDRDRHRKSSHKSSRHKKDIISTTEKLDKKSKEILEQLVDNKIVPPLEDRLWKHVPQEDIVPAAPESDSDHEPSSTVTIPTPPRSQESDDFSSSQMSNETKNSLIIPDNDKEVSQAEERSTSPPPRNAPTEVWRGTINMIDVAQISITAHEVSGDCSGLGKELPENLDIVGRISPDTVWDYIGKMKCSNSKIISLLRLNATNIEEKMPYLALYSYLSSRTRLGVVKSTNKAVKDFYILPLAPQKPIPQALLPLNGPGFEESRPALLLGIIVRDKRKRPHTEPLTPSLVLPKRSRVETPPLPVIPPPVVPPRSYTPPPVKDIRLKLPLPPPLPPTADEDVEIQTAITEASTEITGSTDVYTLTDRISPKSQKMKKNEPYSPEDSDPDAPAPVLMTHPPSNPVPAVIADPIIPPPTYPSIPGLSNSPLPSTTLEIQRQMEELNKKIEMQKSEITSMTQNIVSASSEIGTSALANIALPSNLQQILDSIKTIGETSETPTPPPQDAGQSDLTIPLMIPKTFTRPLSNTSLISQKMDMPSDTIPLNLPSKPKIKPLSVNSPILEEKGSVLGSLSEEDLIRKAAEMLGEEDPKMKRKSVKELLPPTPPKRSKNDVVLPPVPGLEDEIL